MKTAADHEVEEMRLVTTRGVGDAPLPVRYEAAKAALAECASVDECSTWAKKAAALASYARQSEDKSLEQMAMRIRARAIRRCGELLKEIPEKRGQRTDLQPSGSAPTRSQAAERAGLTHDQHAQAVHLANLPAQDFEKAVESDDPPTVADLSERGTHKRAPLVDLQGRDPEDFNRSLLINGAMRDLAEMVNAVSPDALVRGCLPRQFPQMQESADRLANWLSKLLAVLEARK